MREARSFKYRLFKTGRLREVRLDGDLLKYLYDGQVYEVRHPRRVCDFENIVKSKRQENVIVEE